jgi:hypothetical protein
MTELSARHVRMSSADVLWGGHACARARGRHAKLYSCSNV